VNRRARRILGPALGGVVLLGVLFLTVFPTRTWLDQRANISASRAELAELDAELAELDERVAALDSAEEIERIARRDYGMVRPGEEAYIVLPEPAQPIKIPPGWPFTDAPSPVSP
jgi:cell division protein FtsB